MYYNSNYYLSFKRGWYLVKKRDGIRKYLGELFKRLV